MKVPDIIRECRNEAKWSQLTGQCVQMLLGQKRLPTSVLDKMTQYFDHQESQYSGLYLDFVNLLRKPLTRSCIDSLFDAIAKRFVSHIREYAVTDVTDSERLITNILKKQPLWNLIAARCDKKYRNCSYTIKESIIVKKILHDTVPMAIHKSGDKLCCFSPFDCGQMIQFDDSTFIGLLQTLYESSNMRLNLPLPLDRHHKYLKFHTPQENLNYIHGLHIDSAKDFCADITLQWNKQCYYVKASKVVDCKGSGIKTLIDRLMNDECRHVDLRNMDLGDSNVFELESLFKIQGIRSLILSNNKIGVDGFQELLRLQQKYPSSIDYVFIDRNLIHFTEAQYRQIIAFDYRMSEFTDAINPVLNARNFDLSLNYIPSGDNDDAMQESIRKISKIHIQHLGKLGEMVHFPTQIESYCHSIRHPNELKFISTTTGCVLIAEKRPTSLIGRYIFNRGHAFIVIEWIPNLEYGQRQIILADLRKSSSKRNRLEISITIKSPGEMHKILQNCITSWSIFPSNVVIANKLLPRLAESKNQADIFDYHLLPSMKDREERGRHNCISWTDDMMKALDIKIDSMYKSQFRINVFKSIVALVVSVMVFFGMRLISIV